MPQPAVLHVIGGNDRGKTYELVLPETRIGRGADQDLVLADIAVSRRHVTIHAEGGRYRLRDLGSGNGSLVNGARVESVVLNDGDQIEVGNTLMRFDHAASRAQAPGGHAPPPPAVPPYANPASAPAYAPPPPPSYSGAASYPGALAPPSYPGASPVDTPSDAVVARAPMPPGGSGSTSLPIRLAAPFAVQQNRLIAFGVMGFLSLVFLIVIIAKSAFAKPPVAPSDAEELYRQGLKLFAAKDYEGAKVSFGDALPLAPDSPEIKRYIGACDLEVHARGVMQNADRAIASRRYAEAVKALDAVDSGSMLHDDAVRKRKELAPKAASEDVDEARRLQQEDPDTARAKLQQALTLDAGNADARALAAKLHVELPPPPATNVVTTQLTEAPKVEAPPPEPVRAPPPRPVVQAPPPRERERERGKHASRASEDDDFAPVKVKSKESSAPQKGEPSSAQAMAAYKAKDFAGAEKAYRLEARSLTGKKMEAAIAYANQVRDLKTLVDKATAEEGRSPSAAAKDWSDAMAIDARVGHGMHAGFFKQHIGRTQLPVAQQAFAQGRYDVAFNAVQQAQRMGAGDGGLLKQLEAKAKELTDRGAAVQKSNPPQAKQYWHQVMKMVPPSSPSYARAYQLLNSSGGAHKDEDED